MSSIVFRHAIFKSNPVIPFGFFIHSRRYHDDHLQFMTAIRQAVPSLASKKIVIVSDREFTFSEVFPLGFHVYCWNHLENDLHYYLKYKANCCASDISYFANVFKELMLEATEKEFDQTWSELKGNKHFLSSGLVCKYFDQKLLPAFKAHASIWILKSAGVTNPERGITNNPSESINAVLHSLQNWKQVPLDVICISLFHLCSYYHREIEHAIHQCGSMEVKEEFSHYKRDPTLMPRMPKACDPKEIVSKAKGELLSTSISKDDKPISSTIANKAAACTSANSQLGLAQNAVDKKWVTLADAGCWLVKGTDGRTPYAVTLFPKETCSCAAVKSCYHTMACKIMLGQNVQDFTSPNMTLLHQSNRRKHKERPSGRKAPRKNDFHRGNIKGLQVYMATCV